MKLPGSISKRFRKKQWCVICEEGESTWKAPCWDEEDLADVYYACKDCHDAWSCCDCERPPGVWMTTKEERDCKPTLFQKGDLKK
mgnify:CR=1 FL=1